jgi:CPA2 family monovalent cation:H+ antiporter-2
VILVGYGLGGASVARVMQDLGIPFVAIDINPATVKRECARGVPIVYGDASSPDILRLLDVETARVLVLVISDAPSALRITQLARLLNPGIHIIVRSRYITEMTSLLKDGANEVIPEEFETSIEIFSHVLQKYLVPRETINRAIADTRKNAYEMLRSIPGTPYSAASIKQLLPDIEVGSERVEPGCQAEGKTLRELELRTRYGITALAIQRGSTTQSNPNPHERLLRNDLLLILGAPEKLDQLAVLFESASPVPGTVAQDSPSA